MEMLVHAVSKHLDDLPHLGLDGKKDLCNDDGKNQTPARVWCLCTPPSARCLGLHLMF